MALTTALLHALPLDERMWTAEFELCPGRVVAPRLYDLGDSVADWARSVLAQLDSEPFVAVGCSVGGSCAIELSAAGAGSGRRADSRGSEGRGATSTDVA